MHAFSRRSFLQHAGAGSLALGGGLSTFLATSAAQAANTDGYKAIVCLFMKGGMDCHDTILPYDQASYNRYAEIRAELFASYDGAAGGSTRARSRLLELAPRNASRFGDRAFAMPEELAPLHSLFGQEKAAIIGNVGPLIEPMNNTQYLAGSRMRPARLFSHNDQQSTWMTLSPEGARHGWGGRFGDVMASANANADSTFTAISLSGNEVFVTGQTIQQYNVSRNGVETIRELNADRRQYTGNAYDKPIVRQLIEEHFSANGAERANVYERDLMAIRRRSIAANDHYRDALLNAPDFGGQFTDTDFGRDLETVARTIAIRGAIGARRQVFIVSMTGLDTHSGQARKLPATHREMAQGIAAFQTAMESLGLENDVTLFTASDFGRSLAVNGDGTDHGWGGHQFVVGGAVRGGEIFGDIPLYDFDHNLDSGHGRLIPTTSVEQLAYPLGRWFGLSDAEARSALPRVGNFDAPPQFI